MYPNLINVSIIPAPVGYFAVYTDEVDERKTIDRDGMDAILAWRIETYESESAPGECYTLTTPVTLEGDVNISKNNSVGILRPDGAVELGGQMTFDSVAEFLSHRAGPEGRAS